jgi:aspartate aminotransferase-like enzyme
VIPHDKLFIPGPVEVSEKTWAAFSRPLIGHRSEDFKNLYRAIHPGLQTLFGTKQPVFLSTSSAWGVMEASIRNLVGRGVLCCMCGAFSDKWLDVAKRCGKRPTAQSVEIHRPEGMSIGFGDRQIRHFHLTHSETSTGVMNPLEEILLVLARYEVAPSSIPSRLSAVKIDMDALGYRRDAHRRAKRWRSAGFLAVFRFGKSFAREKFESRFYFDFLVQKEQAQWTAGTASGHVHALQFKLDEILGRPRDAVRAARASPRDGATRCAAHFDFFAEEGFGQRH